MTALLNEMIKEADSSKDPQKFYSGAKRVIDGIGEIICYRSYYIRSRRTCRPTEPRTNWKLNGKVISKDALSNLLA